MKCAHLSFSENALDFLLRPDVSAHDLCMKGTDFRPLWTVVLSAVRAGIPLLDVSPRPVRESGLGT